VVAHPHPKCRHALHPMVWEIPQVLAEFVNFALDELLDATGQAEKSAVKLR